VSNNINIILRGIGVCVSIGFLTAAVTPLCNYLASRVAPRPHIEASGAIVVLGARVMKGGMLDDESLRRTIRGIELYKMNLSPILLFSGSGETDDPHMTEAEVRKQLALVMGVPPDAIIKDEQSNTTREESVDIARILRGRGVRRILLVTESVHLRRAMYLFERAGLEVSPAPSDDRALAATSPGDRLRLGIRIAEESAALVYYRLAGYI
jgi:uncharacterized SAM-binding protein YcdF (DUF218 family)